MSSGDPTLMFDLEETIIEYMIYLTVKDGKPLERISELEDSIKSDDYLVDERTVPFVQAGKERIMGAAETLKHLIKNPKTRHNIGDLIMRLEKEEDPAEKLQLAARIGAEINHGAPPEITYKIQDETARNHLQGAKTLQNILTKKTTI